MEQLFLFLSFVFGTIIGSFLNVVILRLPQEESLLGRSHCTHCGHELGPLDLVPVLSFVLLGGRCRYCKKKFSARYALIEIITGLAFLAVTAVLMPQSALGWLELVRALFFVGLLIVVFAIDFEHFLILDTVVVPGLVLLLAINAVLDIGLHQFLSLHGYVISGLLGAVAGSLPFYALWLISKGKWMGFGDVKYMLLLGVALGLKMVGVALLVAFFLGALVSIFLLAVKKKHMSSQVPFGTFLSTGAFITLLWGPSLLAWYLSLLGFNGIINVR